MHTLSSRLQLQKRNYLLLCRVDVFFLRFYQWLSSLLFLCLFLLNTFFSSSCALTLRLFLRFCKKIHGFFWIEREKARLTCYSCYTHVFCLLPVVLAKENLKWIIQRNTYAKSMVAPIFLYILLRKCAQVAFYFSNKQSKKSE